MAERIFDKPLFVEIYNEITVKLYSYVLIDNKADTAIQRQNISGVFGTRESHALASTSKPQTLEKRPAAQMNSEPGIAQNSATRILQINERRTPLLVHFNQNQCSKVKDVFREATSGGNLPAGWNIDRIYIRTRSDYFLSVLLKDSKVNVLSLSKDWLLYSCPVFKQ